MRKKIIAGNWKMNTTREQAEILSSEVVNMVADEVNSDALVVIAPPFVHLSLVGKHVLPHPNVYLGAQNCSEHERGAYTGDISVEILQSVGVEYIILGHSERREHAGESNELLAAKVDSVISGEITPIFCCGESLEIREAGTEIDFVSKQLTESLFHLSAEDIQKVVIAYEPIWAIGTGKTATSQQAQDMHAALRAHLASKYGQEIADEISILYGGSVKAANATELFGQPDVDGGLVGGASLKSREFVEIVKSMA